MITVPFLILQTGEVKLNYTLQTSYPFCSVCVEGYYLLSFGNCKEVKTWKLSRKKEEKKNLNFFWLEANFSLLFIPAPLCSTFKVSLAVPLKKHMIAWKIKTPLK